MKSATTSVDQQEIARHAYAIWIAEGRPDGRQAQHWFQAERQLRAGSARAPDRAAINVNDPNASTAAAPAAAGTATTENHPASTPVARSAARRTPTAHGDAGARQHTRSAGPAASVQQRRS